MTGNNLTKGIMRLDTRWNYAIVWSPKPIKMPLRGGDAKRSDNQANANTCFINANSANTPGMIDANLQPIIEHFCVYSSLYGHTSINFYAFNKNYDKNITYRLKNLRLIREGEPLGSCASEESGFASLSADNYLLS